MGKFQENVVSKYSQEFLKYISVLNESDRIDLISSLSEEILASLETEGHLPIYMKPGSGFTEPTPQPANIGIPGNPGHDAKAIARWNVVPYRMFSGRFCVGVVAFHMNGITGVEFSVNGSDWVLVKEMKLNPQSGTYEYSIQINAEDFEDDIVEIRAIVYPENAGIPRVLSGEINSSTLSNGEHSLILRPDPTQSLSTNLYVSASRGNDTNGNGTQELPYATVWGAMSRYANRNIDGVNILLEPGNYGYGTTATGGRPFTTQGWVTIRPVPGSAPESVRFVTGGRYRVANIHLKDVVLDFSSGGSIGNYTLATLPSMIWLENVRAIGPGPATGARVVPPANWLGMYMTNVRIESFTDGAMFARIARNVHVENLGSDAFTGSKLVVNCTANTVRRPSGTSFHPDVYQFSVTPGMLVENNIIYGVLATDIGAQGMFADDGGTINNVAFVNVLIEVTTPGSKSQWKDVTSNHILFWNTTLIEQPMTWRTTLHTNVSIRGCAWKSIEGQASLQTPGSYLDIRNNHFVLYPGLTFGVDITNGTLAWDSSAEHRLTPVANSPLLGRIPEKLVPVDVLNRLRTNPDDIGAMSRI
jgi:hypothetical protein